MAILRCKSSMMLAKMMNNFSKLSVIVNWNKFLENKQFAQWNEFVRTNFMVFIVASNGCLLMIVARIQIFEGKIWVQAAMYTRTVWVCMHSIKNFIRYFLNFYAFEFF